MNRPKIVATLRLIGDNLDIEDVTQMLGCKPTDARKKGDEIRSGHSTSRMSKGVWRLQLECIDGDIDTAVNNLVRILSSNLDVWKRLQVALEIDLFCGVFLQSSNQGFRMKSQTLMALATRGIDLSFDIYTAG